MKFASNPICLLPELISISELLTVNQGQSLESLSYSNLPMYRLTDRFFFRVSELLDYTAEELTGKNLYTLCHGEDANKLRKCHIDLINKGQVLTHYYRLMNKSGGYTWIQTCATVVCNSKNAEEQNVICVNYVLSAREYGHLVMDCCQMESTSPTVKREAGQDPENGSPDADPGGR